jgi:hypothetical protein
MINPKRVLKFETNFLFNKKGKIAEFDKSKLIPEKYCHT